MFDYRTQFASASFMLASVGTRLHVHVLTGVRLAIGILWIGLVPCEI